ncbi:hypothetical protein BU15DRAFT_74155 [Melanogaster broomeanus]|nr:hypothetical protein BU15DRAFT_74155 [Melanogaster broomeanus]
MQEPGSQRTNFPFDADLTDYLLITLTDIQTLESFVLSSKFVYHVFQARRISVLRTVISNHLGPVLPQAVRLLKVMVDIESYWQGWLAPLPLSKLPKESDFSLNDISLTPREARMLVVNHDVVQELESLYSWRKKDLRSESSQLTQQESERFQQGMYRVWFLCAMYGQSAPANRVTKSRSRRSAKTLEKLGRMHAQCLQSFTRSQLEPVLETWRFLRTLANWVSNAEFLTHEDFRSLGGYLVWSGPATTLRAFRGNMSLVDRKVLLSMSASYNQFHDVFTSNQPRNLLGSGILESPFGVNSDAFICQKCNVRGFGGIWSESNWSYLRGILPPSRIYDLIELPWWNTYMDAHSLENICRSVPYPQFIRELFALQSTYKPGRWLCTDCLKTFIGDNIEEWCGSQGYPERVEQ